MKAALCGYYLSMATIARRSGRVGPRAGFAARRGLSGVARIVSLITSVVVGLILIAIVLVLLDANQSNGIVNWLVDAGRWLSQPFHNIFQPSGTKARVAINWGVAAVIYAIVGSLIARVLRR
jgi:hypothetical protein